MDAKEQKIIESFKALLQRNVSIHKIILFGSRARGDASLYSDMDVVVITDNTLNEQEMDYVSDSAWESGFEYGIVVVPVVFSKDEWENSPERYSLLAQAVEMEGVPV